MFTNIYKCIVTISEHLPTFINVYYTFINASKNLAGSDFFFSAVEA